MLTRLNHDPLLYHAHILRARAVWDPLARLSRRSLLQHPVYLFEGQPFHLRDQEVREGDGKAAQATPDEEDLGTEVRVAVRGADQVGRYDCDDLCLC